MNGFGEKDLDQQFYVPPSPTPAATFFSLKNVGLHLAEEGCSSNQVSCYSFSASNNLFSSNF